MKKLIKAIGKSEAVRVPLCWFASLYIRLLHLTGQWTVLNIEVPRAYWDDGKPFILAFWHGRLLMMPYCWDLSKQISMLISQHKDGRLIARTVSHFGIRTVVGSSSKGGAGAIRSLLRLMKSGEWVGLTPDGPRGPRMRVSEGIIMIAKLSGVPIIPATYSAAPSKILKSWDRHMLPRLFGRGVIIWGEPMEVPRDADLEACRLELEQNLNAITAEADIMMGHEPVGPA